MDNENVNELTKECEEEMDIKIQKESAVSPKYRNINATQIFPFTKLEEKCAI